MGMGTETGETQVTESGGTAIPAHVREHLDLRPGDKLRWTADENGELRVELLRERSGVFDEFEGYDMGETDSEELAESAYDA